MIQFPTLFPVTSHTDFVGQGSTFVVIKGMKADGISFIPLALERGATTIVIEHDVQLDEQLLNNIASKSAHIIRVENSRQALACMSAEALNHPAQKLKIIGITGTKGKTTSAFLLAHILREAGFKTALLSTVCNTIAEQEFSTNLTTQHPDYLHVFFNQCVKAGMEYVVMETAAQAYNLNRTYGLEFDAFLFTNFDQEHAEFYATIEDYFFAKCSLMQQTKNGAPIIINADSIWYNKLIQAHKTTFFSFGKRHADYIFTKQSSTVLQTLVELSFIQESLIFSMPLIGDFNCYNSVGVFAVCHQIGIAIENVVRSLTTFRGVPGRLEKYQLPNGAVCFIDFAHNPSSYESVLATLRPLTDRLIVVCGAGGDRDRAKRPAMAAWATRYADSVILTNDNPRTENPDAIIADLVSGIAPKYAHKYSIELDRYKAIKKAYELSCKDSILLLLGKGPDHYQLVGDEKLYFNEAEIIQNL